MLCEKCKKNIANVYLKNIINGEVTESYLCSECMGASNMSLPGGGGDFKSDIFNALNFGKFAAPAGAVKNDKCPMCQLSFADITKSGKVGCGQCYRAFKAELEPNVMRLHGTTRHTGKIPKNMSARLGTKRKIEELDEKLKKMVAEQNYEEAAVIRDEINKIKKESEGA